MGRGNPGNSAHGRGRPIRRLAGVHRTHLSWRCADEGQRWRQPARRGPTRGEGPADAPHFTGGDGDGGDVVGNGDGDVDGFGDGVGNDCDDYGDEDDDYDGGDYHVGGDDDYYVGNEYDDDNVI